MDARRNSFCNLIDYVATGVDTMMEGMDGIAKEDAVMELLPQEEPVKKKEKKKKKRASVRNNGITESAAAPEPIVENGSAPAAEVPVPMEEDIPVVTGKVRRKSAKDKKKKKPKKKIMADGSAIELDSGDDLSLGSMPMSHSDNEEETADRNGGWGGGNMGGKADKTINVLSSIADSDEEGDGPNAAEDPASNILAQAARRRATMAGFQSGAHGKKKEKDTIIPAEAEGSASSSEEEEEEEVAPKSQKERRHTLGVALKGFQIDASAFNDSYNNGDNNNHGNMDMSGLTKTLPKISIGNVKQKYNFNQDPKRRENAFDQYMNPSKNNS